MDRIIKSDGFALFGWRLDDAKIGYYAYRLMKNPLFVKGVIGEYCKGGLQIFLLDDLWW